MQNPSEDSSADVVNLCKIAIGKWFAEHVKRACVGRDVSEPTNLYESSQQPANGKISFEIYWLALYV